MARRSSSARKSSDKGESGQAVELHGLSRFGGLRMGPTEAAHPLPWEARLGLPQQPQPTAWPSARPLL